MPIHLLKGRLICKRSPAFLAPHQWVGAGTSFVLTRREGAGFVLKWCWFCTEMQRVCISIILHTFAGRTCVTAYLRHPPVSRYYSIHTLYLILIQMYHSAWKIDLRSDLRPLEHLRGCCVHLRSRGRRYARRRAALARGG